MNNRFAQFKLGNSLKALLVSACLIILFSYMAPFEVWKANKSEFTFDIVSIFWESLSRLPWIVAAGVAVLMAILPRKLGTYILAIGVIAFVIFLIEFNLFQGGSQLVGNDAEGVGDSVLSISPLWIYVPLILIAVVLPGPVVTMGVPVVVFITVTQLATMIFSSQFTADNQKAQALEKLENVFEFSENGGTLVVLLDELQTGYFLDIYEKEFKAQKSLMPGFTLFKDHLGLYPMTEYSLQQILTGKIYRNDSKRSTRAQFYAGNDHIVGKMLENGNLVEIVDQIGAGYGRRPGLARALIPVPYDNLSLAAQVGSEAMLLESIVIDRLVPDFAYSIFNMINRSGEVEEEETTDPDQNADKAKKSKKPKKLTASQKYLRDRQVAYAVYFRNVADRMTIIPGNPKFKFIHILTTHNPAALDENCNFNRILTATFATMRPQTICVMRSMFDIFKRMQALKIYDKTRIVIFADHGRRTVADADRFLEQRNYGKVQNPPRYNYLMAQVIASARPILLVKPANSRKPFRISNAPTQYTDIVPTIKQMAGIELDENERSAFDIGENEKRPRETFHYFYHKRNSQYQDRLITYTVNGKTTDPKSWKRLHKDYIAPGLNFKMMPITMGIHKNRYFEYSGWKVDIWRERRKNAEVYASTADSVSKIQFQFSSPGDKRLSIKMRTEPSFPDQQVELAVDGVSIGTIDLEKPFDKFKTYDITIPGNLVSKDPAALQILSFKPKRMRKSWTKDEQRIAYGVHVATITISEIK